MLFACLLATVWYLVVYVLQAISYVVAVSTCLQFQHATDVFLCKFVCLNVLWTSTMLRRSWSERKFKAWRVFTLANCYFITEQLCQKPIDFLVLLWYGVWWMWHWHWSPVRLWCHVQQLVHVEMHWSLLDQIEGVEKLAITPHSSLHELVWWE